MTNDATEDLRDLVAMHQEPLCEELEPYLVDGPLGQMVAHPLVHHISLVPGIANRTLKWKRRNLAQAEEKEDWSSYVFIHERPYRTNALLELRNVYGVDGPEFAAVAAEVWIDTENIHQHLDDWARIMSTTDGQDWMLDDERAEFEALPEQLTIWRGECDDGDVSWTLKESTAVFFANRATHNGKHIVTRGRVFKRDVFCYLTRRGEFEIIVPDRSKVQVISETPT